MSRRLMDPELVNFLGHMRPHFRIRTTRWPDSTHRAFTCRKRECRARMSLTLGKDVAGFLCLINAFYQHADNHRRHPWPWPMTPIGSRIVTSCVNCNRYGLFVIQELNHRADRPDWLCKAVHGCAERGHDFLQWVTAGVHSPMPTGHEARDHINRQLVGIWNIDLESGRPGLQDYGREMLERVRAGEEPREIMDDPRSTFVREPAAAAR